MLGILLSLAIGALGVLQNTLNRQLAPRFGLPSVLMVNSLVMVGCGTIFYLLVKMLPQESLPPLYRVGPGLRSDPFLLLPGLFGFFIVATVPWAIERMGATRVFIGIIAAQMVVSMLWDWRMENVSVSAWRILGALLALAGAAVAAL
ncbi:MAG TPA: DMT family transporter [Bdellovibrionota bacterium]|jgi:uncharacterized membrane protein YdcZ (DUF606 family)